MERWRKGRVLVERVLEAGGEMDLGRLDSREAVEELVRQGGGSMLDGAGQAVLASQLAEPSEDLEVELHLGHGPVGQRHAPCEVPVCTLTLLIPAAPGRAP